MSRHTVMMEQLNNIDEPEVAFAEPKGQKLLTQTLVHAADLSGQALCVHVYHTLAMLC
jgi:hypothetical protein